MVMVEVYGYGLKQKMLPRWLSGPPTTKNGWMVVDNPKPKGLNVHPIVYHDVPLDIVVILVYYGILWDIIG